MRIQPPRISDDKISRILELKEQGMDSAKVARLVGVSPPTVIRTYNKKRGVPPVKVKKYEREVENNLTPVENLDFEKDGYFCIDKWARYNQVTKHTNGYKKAI